MGLFSRLTVGIRAKSRSRRTIAMAESDYRDRMCDDLGRALKASMAEFGDSARRLRTQLSSLESCVGTLDERARQAACGGHDRRAAVALYHKAKVEEQILRIEEHVGAFDRIHARLGGLSDRLAVKKQGFHSERDSVMSRHMTADQADFLICDAAAGMDEELADVEYAIDRAKAKVATALDLLATAEATVRRCEATDLDEAIPEKELADAMRKARTLMSEAGPR